MGGERAHRLDAEAHRPAAARDEELLENGVPGKRTHVEQLLEQLSYSASLPLQQTPGRRTLLNTASTARVGFEDYRALGLSTAPQNMGTGSVRGEKTKYSCVAGHPDDSVLFFWGGVLKRFAACGAA